MVGSVDITATNASVDSFEFHGQKSTSVAEDTEDKKPEVKKQNKVFQINLRVIAANCDRNHGIGTVDLLRLEVHR